MLTRKPSAATPAAYPTGKEAGAPLPAPAPGPALVAPAPAASSITERRPGGQDPARLGGPALGRNFLAGGKPASSGMSGGHRDGRRRDASREGGKLPRLSGTHS